MQLTDEQIQEVRSFVRKKGKARAKYKEKLLVRLSSELSQKFGKGFSPTNLKMMRLFINHFQFIRQCLTNLRNLS